MKTEMEGFYELAQSCQVWSLTREEAHQSEKFTFTVFHDQNSNNGKKLIIAQTNRVIVLLEAQQRNLEPRHTYLHHMTCVLHSISHHCSAG